MKRSIIPLAALLLAGCGAHSASSTAPTSTRSTTSSASAPVAASRNPSITYGAQPDVLAKKLGLSQPHPDPSQSPNDPQFPVIGTFLGTLNGKTVVLCTFAKAADEITAAGTMQAGGPFLPPGEHWYAGADGWFGYSTDFDKATAQLIASKLGGSIKQIG